MAGEKTRVIGPVLSVITFLPECAGYSSSSSEKPAVKACAFEKVMPGNCVVTEVPSLRLSKLSTVCALSICDAAHNAAIMNPATRLDIPDGLSWCLEGYRSLTQGTIPRQVPEAYI